MSDLTCPKCGGSMRSYERNGVTVDQCGDCRGIFLDRGELERLVDAEGAHYEREFSERRRDDERRDDRRDDERHRDDRHRDEHRGGKPKKSKKRSFLENLMEGMGE